MSQDYRGEFGIDVMFGVSCDQVDLIGQYVNLPPYNIPPFTFKITLDTHILSQGRDMSRYKTPDDVYTFLGHLEAIVFPLLALVQDIQSLDKLMNGGSNNGLNDKVAAAMNFGLYRQRLIVACLANNPDFENLVLTLKPQPIESREARTIEGNNARATQWDNLVKYLREELQNNFILK